MGSWQTVGDPSVYGLLEIDVGPALEYLNSLQKKTDIKVTLSHLVGKAAAIVLKERPEINGLIRFSRIYQRKHVDLFYQVNVAADPNDPVGKATLTGATVRKAETLSVLEIAKDLNQKSQGLKRGEAGELTKSINTMAWIPWQLIRTVLNFTSWLNFDLRLNLTWAGMPRDPFGSIMITNVGGMGVETAWAPLVPYTKVPLLLTIGKVTDRAWVVNGEVKVRPIVRIGITFDHRFMDGVHAAEMKKTFQRCFAEPEKYFS